MRERSAPTRASTVETRESGIGSMTVALCHNLRMDSVEPQLTERRAMGEVLVAAVMFGTTGTARALGAASASPLGVGAARLAIGGAVLVGIARHAGQRIPASIPRPLLLL